MYIYIKIGKRVFTFGNDRKDTVRRRENMPVENEHRECMERRREGLSSGKSTQPSEDNGDNN